MMSGRANILLVLSIWLIVVSSFRLANAERWSRQVSNSDWIPLANPRNLQAQSTVQNSQNLPPLPQIHQPLIPGSLPPELRQEYQQQLLQLQKTQESIQRLLLLQEELKAQQQILQSQGYLPNGIAEGEENKRNLQQGSNSQLPEQPGDVLVPPPQLSSQARPPVYSSQNFREPQTETVRQEQYDDYNDRQVEDYGNTEQTRESLRDREKYVPEAPAGSTNNGERINNDDEEVQVVYVPAETLAQHGHLKNQRGRDRKQFGNQEIRPHHEQHRQRPFVNQRGQEPLLRDRENVGTTVPPQEDVYAREYLQQLQHEGNDRLLKEARQKELERLREERKEIQRRAKLQQEALEREQEIQRQREAEKSRKELAKLEETAKQRELERLRGVREKQREEELERAKKAQARVNEKKRKQEEARQAEIERLASQERQKKAELERASKERKEEEERAQEAERNDSTRHRLSGSDSSPEAHPLIRNQHNQQQHQTNAGKYNRQNRNRNKPRQRHHNIQNAENFEHDNNEPTTTTQPSPNQPPLAVYMVNAGGDGQTLRVSDVLKTLKDAKTIDVLDNVGQDAPQVFVGPSNLEVTSDYAKFDLPYLSSIDNNRVERRVDKLPFFVAPLSFNPPPGYAKIPFPAPHIGSVVINTLDPHIASTQSEESYQDVRKPNLNPLIEPNSFIQNSDQGISYSTTYNSPTTASYTNYRQEEPSSTTQYQSTPSYSTVETSGPGTGYRFRQQFNSEQPSAPAPEQIQPRPAYHEPQLRPAFQEESPLTQSSHSSQYSDESSGSTTPIYRRPNVVTSFAYQESPQPVSSTPVYQESYTHIREDSTIRHPNAQLESINHDLSEHREVVQRYQLENNRGQEYSNGPIDSGVNTYEDTLRGPTQYNLPAELPPITPQLPGLVNSLLDEREQAAFVNRQAQTTTIPTTTTTTTTTTEAPTTTQRTRGRQRARVTRPTTTTQSPTSRSVTRRPVSRSRSRFTTTTEEYRENYEPTKSKVSDTAERYNAQESFRRPASIRNQKLKNRETESSGQASKNHVHDVQAHEADTSDRTTVLKSNSQAVPNEQPYHSYHFATSSPNLENYPVASENERRPLNSPTEVDYTKNLDYPQTQPLQALGLRNQDEQIGVQYKQEQYTNSELEQPSLENAPVNGFNYQTRNPQDIVTPTIPPTSRDYAFYQNKPDNFPGSQDSVDPIDAPINSQIRNYQRPVAHDSSRIQNEDLPRSQYPVSNDKALNYEAVDSAVYDSYPENNQKSGVAAQQAPVQTTTETTTTTSTTTEPPPVVIRQRVRGRLGVRGRPDSNIQTRPRGSQEEYVRFSAVNNQNTPTTERPSTRQRETTRQRPKSRHQYQGTVQVQTEGNDYVRIQAPIRTYQKTIVTPPSTTRRTTTTPAPTITTAQYEEAVNDGLEYGFIRAPNFGPSAPVENRHQNIYRPVDNQAQLQSIAPTDETAEDSNLSHTQITRNRPKYQSPNRRPSSKPAATTTLASDISPYTEKSRTRVEEPKNNRIRVKGRKPGRRRTTTTTTTTTEYILEDTNALPLEENYPRPIQRQRQDLYEEKFEALPLASGSSRNPIRQQSGDDTYSSQDFLMNFGNGPTNSEPDQTQLASQPPRNYGQSFGTRSRTHSTHRGGQERDIHGAESQWSTKLTSNSFQPSPSANRLPQDDQKTAINSDSEKNKYANDEASPDAPEIITAAPDDSYVTVLVTSDDKQAKSMSAEAMEPSEMEGFNFGMKTNVEGRSSLENTTPIFTSQDAFVTQSTNANDASTESALSGQTENFTEQSTNSLPTRRMGGRRRRVRVRVRPVATEDFVTAESQHFNSAINNLVQDRLKFNRFEVESKDVPITTESPISPQESTTSDAPKKTIFEDFFDEMFKGENKSSIEIPTTQADDIMTTMKNEDVYGQDDSEISTTYGFMETTTDPAPDISDDENSNESLTNIPVTETTLKPAKSWDSTKQYIDSIAMHSGEYFTDSKYPENTGFDENLTGQGNEVFQNEYGQKTGEVSGREDDDNYPKNHRSEWSEVRYPSDRGLFNYHRKLNLTAAQLPGVVTKAEGDTNVKTLSDYVKAIFDTMKNADEQKTEEGNFSTTVTNNQDDSTSTDQEFDKDSTTVPSVRHFGDVFSDVFSDGGNPEQTLETESVMSEKKETAEEIQTPSESLDKIKKVVEMSGDSSGLEKVEPTEQSTISATVETVKTTEIPFSTSTLDTSTAFPMKIAENSNVPKIDDISTTTTTEKSPIAIATSKLSGVVRTSTTTKVSHMTEICFRGRCVMTKPKKELDAR